MVHSLETFVPVGLTPRKPLVNDFFQPDFRYGSLTCFIDFSLFKSLCV
jgi:hypothetical protein